MTDLIEIDGSIGEGGWQVVRTSLALSIITGRAFRMGNIRAGRRNPGLGRQHRTAVAAAAAVSDAWIAGNEIGSPELTFSPSGIRPGTYDFSVGTAGSCTLVLQTVLPALLCAEGESQITVEGGTHNPFAPPFDFLEQVFLPIINRIWSTTEIRLVRHGFYPAGGGIMEAIISPQQEPHRICVEERGAIRNISARALVARLPRHIAERELGVIKGGLSVSPSNLRIEEIKNAAGPGNVVHIKIECEHTTELFTAFGRRGVSAETVAGEAVKAAMEYLSAGVPIGKHLADQLLLPMALAGGGSFRTVAPTRHFTTNTEIIRQFLPVTVTASMAAVDDYRIEIK
jgi:RNA 3'-terminal phosphate cyclase (ATP)